MEGPFLQDSELAARARGGDPAAYEVLVRGTEEVAFRTAYLILGDAAEAEDAAQEGFVKAYYALDRFRPDAPFRPWLLQIVANEARNRRRAAGRRAALALRAAGSPPGASGRASDADDPAPSRRVAADLPAAGTGASPEAAALAAEQRATLVAALDGLRDEERLAVAYRYFLDLDEAEMAAVLGCARGTVKSRLSRGLARLRGLLAGASDG